MADTTMHPLAVALNKQLQGTALFDMLSDYGKRLYFPKGIIAQGAEAGAHADRINATIGTAQKDGKLMGFPLTGEPLSEALGLSYADIFNYAPTAGLPELRKKWLEEMRKKNPSLTAGVSPILSTLPAVCPGLTAAVVLATEFFLNEGETLLVPDIHWGNYDLAINVHHGIKIQNYPLFKEGVDERSKDPMALEALQQELAARRGEKVGIIFNFPNNFSGYSPQKQEVELIAAMLKAEAEHGTRIIVFTDDAYFGLFFAPETHKESLYSACAGLHKNITAVKIDGATKEEAVWGMRVGFVTIANPELNEEQIKALEQKLMGAIRAAYSNSPRLSQAIVLRALNHPDYAKQKAELFSTLQCRYAVTRQCCKDAPRELLRPLPFNSGYFMAFATQLDAEELRLLLLERGIGCIAIGSKYLRVAFSSVNTEDIPNLFDEIYAAARELAAQAE